jgi:8-hydroxy-5-deazaflavin:NADPH oxidoreductase
MKIGIIGSGNIGGNLARLFIKAGHEVALANTRGPSSLRNFVYELGGDLHPIDADGAVVYGEVIVVSIPWRSLDTLPVFNVPGKIIVDTTNPYASDGTLYDLGSEISSSKVIEHFPEGSLVKAFNSIWYKHLVQEGDVNLPHNERRVIPLAGDERKAKEKVSKLIEEIGFGPLDTGTLKEGTRLQGIQGVLYNKDFKVKEAISILKDLD